MRAEDRVRLRHMIEAAESARQFVVSRQAMIWTRITYYCLPWSARVGSAEQGGLFNDTEK
jgi:hypothetical protein